MDSVQNPEAKSPQAPRWIIDARMVGPVPHGIARYVTLAARGIEERLRLKPSEVPFEPWYLMDPKLNPDPDARSFPRKRIIWVDAPFLSLRELWVVPRAVRRAGARLFWSPSFSSYLTGRLGIPCPWMVTIHDLNHLHFGNWIQKLYYRVLLKPFALSAKRILTVSEFSRGEIAAWLGVASQKISVVYNAIDPELWEKPASLAPKGRPKRPYFLCLGNPKPHKNIPFLVEAYRLVRRDRMARGLDCWDLVITGVKGEPSQGIHWGVRIPDHELSAWISGAGAMVFPSSYEGFGLPPVEAAALGTPVIASDIAPHREGLGTIRDGVTWVPPENESGLASALATVMEASRSEGARRHSAQDIQGRFTIERLSDAVLRLAQAESR